MIKGVNLGNWLVLEKWMSPAPFEGTGAEDETDLCTDLDDVAKLERFKTHRDTWIGRQDFLYLANHGIDTVRIPVPFFIFGEYPPYVGCIEYLDQAFDWARESGLKILIDLHTVPDSQNGFDNGGMCGVCKWHLNPGHVEFALSVLERLTVRYRDHPALWGIEVLNEPVSADLWELIRNTYPPTDPEYARGSEAVPTDFLKDFYLAAYRRIRAQSAEVTVVFHDGFRIREWDGFFELPEFERIVLDTHLYLMEHTMRGGDQTLAAYLGVITDSFATTVTEMASRVPLIVGEWCLDPMSPHVDALSADERLEFLRQVADAQLAAWDSTAGWFFWSYKLHVEGSARDGWDLGASIEHGYLPARLEPAAEAAPA